MTDLGRWHHGASNEIECVGMRDDATVAHGVLDSNLSDARSLRLAREHAAKTGHTVEINRTVWRFVFPPDHTA